MIRLGAVTYLNARPLVYGLESREQFALRYDIPSECARLLHARETDVGLIPSIEYLRGPGPYAIVPGPAVTTVGSTALMTWPACNFIEPRFSRSRAASPA